MKIAIVDIETTGLDPTKHEIIEIGCVIFNDRGFEITDWLDVKVRPKHIETADPIALQVNGYNEEEWKDAIGLGEAMSRLMEKAEDAVFCSYPVVFDYPFIQQIGVEESFSHYKLCLFSMVYSRFGKPLSMKDACERFDIQPEPKVHRAMNGAMCEYNLYRALHEDAV